MSAPNWLTRSPIAHRGFHDASLGIIENSISAAYAAISNGYSIECDVQLSADGVVMVFHDDTLDRLTDRSGFFDRLKANELCSLTLLNSTDNIPTLETFLRFVNGQSPIICEIKSKFDGNLDLARQTVEVIQNYHGPLAIKSFDPDVVTAISQLAPNRPRGFIGESHYDDAEWDFVSASQKTAMANIESIHLMRPDFLSWYIKDVEHGAPQLARKVLGLPLMTWTVRNLNDQSKAFAYADQIIFEGFTP